MNACVLERLFSYCLYDSNFRHCHSFGSKTVHDALYTYLKKVALIFNVFSTCAAKSMNWRVPKFTTERDTVSLERCGTLGQRAPARSCLFSRRITVHREHTQSPVDKCITVHREHTQSPVDKCTNNIINDILNKSSPNHYVTAG